MRERKTTGGVKEVRFQETQSLISPVLICDWKEAGLGFRRSKRWRGSGNEGKGVFEAPLRCDSASCRWVQHTQTLMWKFFLLVSNRQVPWVRPHYSVPIVHQPFWSLSGHIGCLTGSHVILRRLIGLRELIINFYADNFKWNHSLSVH